MQPKFTLAELGIKLVLSKLVQDESQVLLMLFFRLGEDEYVINEDDNKLVLVFHEDLVHEVHEVGRGIVQPK